MIIQENADRNKLLDAEYKPLLGIGSLIERFDFRITDDLTVKLPVSMKQEKIVKEVISVGSLENLSTSKNAPFDDLLTVLLEIREIHDFEYWATLKVKIKPKQGGALIRFSLNRPQRRVLSRLEKMRLAGKPIRAILLKARQWGGSTLIQIYMAWIQIKHKTNWNSLIAADVNQQAINIRAMYTTLVNSYGGDITLKTFEQANNIKFIPERSNKITIGSMQKPDTIRSDDVKMSHLSEVGLWKKTEGKEPKDLVQAILGTIPSLPYTVYILESTAKGIGNFFHQTWLAAVEGRNNLDPLFVPWYEIEQYREKIETPEEMLQLYKSFDDYEKWLWELGATLEGVKWYRYKLKEYDGDTWRMRSEFPSTAQEAFQSTGRRVYSPALVEKMRLNCTPPVYKGQLYANGDKGKEALQNITFEKGTDGNLWIWELPDKSVNVSNRYLVSVDIGGASKDADWTVMRVFDRYWMMYGGVPEAIATLKIHIDRDLMAWLAVQLGEFYNHAVVAFENNSLDKKKNTEGEGYLTALNEIADYYDNLYVKSSPQDQIKEGMPVKYGFHTNSASKDMIITCKTAAMRDDGFIERDSRACDESDTFERKADGTVGAVDGCHDDEEMSTNIGLWIALHDMPFPKIIDINKAKADRAKNRKKIRSEASF